MPGGHQLPGLIDCSGIMGELGITRAAAEKIMRGLPLVTFPELRKVYVRRDDLGPIDRHEHQPTMSGSAYITTRQRKSASGTLSDTGSAGATARLFTRAASGR